MRQRQLCAALGASVFLVVTSAPPASSVVCSCGAGDVACLVAGITTANSNGEANAIRLEAGTYVLAPLPNPVRPR
jgi:hypothetical protein